MATLSEIIGAFSMALKLAGQIIEKIEEVKDENEKAKIQDAMARNDVDALRRLLFK